MSLSTPVERRFRVVALALTLPALAMLILTGIHLRNSLRSRAALVAAAEETVRHRLVELLDIFYIEIFRGTVNPGLGVAPLAVALSAHGTPEPAQLLAELARGYDSLLDCRCSTLLPVKGLFVYRNADRGLAYRGSTPLSVVRLRMERVTRLQQGDSPPVNRRMRILADQDAGGPYVLVYAWGGGIGLEGVVVGFDANVEALGQEWFGKLHRWSADTVFGTADSLSSIGLKATHPSGTVLYQAGDLHGITATLTTFGNGLRLGGAAGSDPITVTLSYGPAAVARIIPGGIPPSPWPLAITAALFALLLAGLSLVLLRSLRQLLVLREQFVSGVSHELRTPLTLIIMYADSLLLDRPTPAARRRAAGVIAREGRRLITLVENALQFVRGQRPEIAFDIATRDLGMLVGAVAEDLAPLAREREADLCCELESGLLGQVDAGAFRQIVVNLVDNALRFGPTGQTVRVRLVRDDQAAFLTVDDEGPGVPAESREQIWQPFYRHNSTRDMSTTGAGLGLTTVRHLTQTFGGEVWVEDAPGRGARFVVRLPLVHRGDRLLRMAHSA